MEGEIRALFIKYGIAEVKECMEKECRRMYESLQSIYEVKRKYEKKAKASEPVPTEAPTAPVAPAEPIEQPVAPVEPVEEPVTPTEPLKKHIRKVKVIKNEEVKEPESKEVEEIIKKSNSLVPVEVSESGEEIREVKEVVDEKERQRIAVAQKRQELLEQGIEPESLLTKENLEKWLKSGKSYMRIAKETGVDEGEVSRTARGFGLTSVMAKYKFLRIPKKS
jgi:hypothetical protein